MRTTLTHFPLPHTPATPTHSILPVFMPYAGCPFRCVFCAQDAQTGTVSRHPGQALRALRRRLVTPRHDTSLYEVAFYGGTFTALPASLQRPCLAFTRDALQKGLIVSARCSTRPDAVSPSQLNPLKEAGINLVELGVQSFHDNALERSARGYSGLTAREACSRVLNAGLALGIQLLPGMPGLTPEAFLDDVDTALSFQPSCMRFYPCLVLDGTMLAHWWRQGSFVPWSLAVTVKTLGEALKRAWAASVPVIRVGLAPEPSLDRALLAGPWHPALGSRVQGEALLRTVVDSRVGASGKTFRLLLPARCQGFVFGHQGELKTRWAELGLAEIIWHTERYGAWQPVKQTEAL